MSQTLERVRGLVRAGDYRLSEHGRRRLADAGVREEEAVAGIAEAKMVEDYPGFAKGPCVLVLQRDDDGVPYHVLWGTPMRLERPAVLITGYRPDPRLWSEDFRRRRM